MQLMSGRALLRLLTGAMLILFVVPITLGMAGTVLPAFGYMPTLAPGNGFLDVVSDSRFPRAVLLTLFTGLSATALVLLLSIIALVSLHRSRLWSWLSAAMPPLLAVPHAAIAVGLVFLISPSGAVVRMISPSLTGWSKPPDAWIVPDALGLSLILGLVIKEVPFLILAAAAQLSHLNVDASLKIGRTLGYSPARCWSRLILPRLYPRIRLVLLIIMGFNLTVVDMALLLGPSTPPTFSVFLMSLVNDPGSRAAASAGALLLCVLVAACFASLRLLEGLVSRVARARRRSGARGKGSRLFRILGKVVVVLMVVLSIASMLVLLIWSVTRRWRFPDMYPSTWSLHAWISEGADLLSPALSTLSISLSVAVLAMLATVVWLELERLGHAPKLDGLWYVPLLVPQVSLIFGWQAMAYWAGADGLWITVVYSHWLFSMPYVVLILAVAWREFDPYWNHAAHTLGAGYFRVLFRVRLPLMIKPLCQAAAVAIAVSVAQYLPTLLLGAGRHQTLAIELVTSFGGGDRRAIAALAVLQSLLPLCAFVLALAYPYHRSMKQARNNARAVPAGGAFE